MKIDHKMVIALIFMMITTILGMGWMLAMNDIHSMLWMWN
jgi:hypothetical protein